MRATILARHHFSSHLKRMSCIVRVERDANKDNKVKGAKSTKELWAVLKGAPEMVKQFLGECVWSVRKCVWREGGGEAGQRGHLQRYILRILRFERDL